MDDNGLDTLGQTIVGALPGIATGHSVAFGQLTLTVDAGKIVEVMRLLRDDLPEQRLRVGEQRIAPGGVELAVRLAQPRRHPLHR